MQKDELVAKLKQVGLGCDVVHVSHAGRCMTGMRICGPAKPPQKRHSKLDVYPMSGFEHGYDVNIESLQSPGLNRWNISRLSR